MTIGEVAEWSKALVLKTSNGVTRSWVRIPPSPPYLAFNYKVDYIVLTLGSQIIWTLPSIQI